MREGWSCYICFVLAIRAYFVTFLFSRCQVGRVHLDTLPVGPGGMLDSWGRQNVVSFCHIFSDYLCETVGLAWSRDFAG